MRKTTIGESTLLRGVENNTKAKDWIFVIAMWFLSRLVIVVAMQVISPALYTAPTYLQPLTEGLLEALDALPREDYIPKASWEIMTHYDGDWYAEIATIGYSYADDGKMYPIAFYPLYPIITRAVMMLGLSADVAGVVVNNLGFLGALVLLYFWVKERYGTNVARWSTTVLALYPYSLFTALMYAEGLFLLFTTAALRAFENHQHIRAGLFGAIATATRAPGITLVSTFLLIAWKERRPLSAYAAGLAVGIGIVLFMIFCAISFQNPLAFIHAQKAWGQPTWLDVFRGLFTGNGHSWTTLFMVFGGAYLLWHLRRQLSRVVIVYGFCSLALLVSSGVLHSISRYAYAIVSLSIGLGFVLSSHPRWGYLLMSIWAIMLGLLAMRFACGGWVA
jgi:Gpi18-like mannosyltransferase